MEEQKQQDAMELTEKTEMTVLPHTLTFAKPSDEMTRQIPIYQTTWIRLTKQLRQCRQYGAGVLSNLASGSFGIALTCGAQAVIERDPAKPVDRSWIVWAVIAGISLFGTIVFGLCAGYVRRRENASLQSVIDEMEEHRDRWT